jgi:hypothetical protein
VVAVQVHNWVLHEWMPELALSLAKCVDGLTGVAWVSYGPLRAGPPRILPSGSCRPPSGTCWPCSACPTHTPAKHVSIDLSAVVTAAWLSFARDRRARWCGWSL